MSMLSPGCSYFYGYLLFCNSLSSVHRFSGTSALSVRRVFVWLFTISHAFGCLALISLSCNLWDNKFDNPQVLSAPVTNNLEEHHRGHGNIHEKFILL